MAMWSRNRKAAGILALSPVAEAYVRNVNERVEASGSPYRPDPFWVRAHGSAIELDEGPHAVVEMALTWPNDVDTVSWVVTHERIYVAVYDHRKSLVSGYTVALHKLVSCYTNCEMLTVAGPGAFFILGDVGGTAIAAEASDRLCALIEAAALPHSDPPLACIAAYSVAFARGLHPIVEEKFATVTAHADRLSVQGEAGESSISADDVVSITAEGGVLHIDAGEQQLVGSTDLPESIPAHVLTTCLATGRPFGKIVSHG